MSIKKTIKDFILLFGVGLFTYNLFSFNSGYHLGHSGVISPNEVIAYPITTYYYYSHTALILLTIGAIFIAVGLLKGANNK